MSDKKDGKAQDKAPQMGGMAGDAQRKMRVTPAYRQYQIMKMENGEKPVSLEDFIAGKK